MPQMAVNYQQALNGDIVYTKLSYERLITFQIRGRTARDAFYAAITSDGTGLVTIDSVDYYLKAPLSLNENWGGDFEAGVWTYSMTLAKKYTP